VGNGQLEMRFIRKTLWFWGFQLPFLTEHPCRWPCTTSRHAAARRSNACSAPVRRMLHPLSTPSKRLRSGTIPAQYVIKTFEVRNYTVTIVLTLR
jgi:hypothetical protein